MQPLNTNDPFTSLNNLVSSGYKMPEFNSQQFSSPNGPTFGGSSSPFGGGLQTSRGMGGMGGGGGGNIGAALQSAAQQIVASNQQLIQALNKVATALTQGTTRPGMQPPGSPSGPGGGGGGRGFGGIKQQMHSRMAKRMGGGFKGGALATVAMYGAESMVRGGKAAMAYIHRDRMDEMQLGFYKEDLEVGGYVDAVTSSYQMGIQGNIGRSQFNMAQRGAYMSAAGGGTMMASLAAQRAGMMFDLQASGAMSVAGSNIQTYQNRYNNALKGIDNNSAVRARYAAMQAQIDKMGGKRLNFVANMTAAAFSKFDFRGVEDITEANRSRLVDMQRSLADERAKQAAIEAKGETAKDRARRIEEAYKAGLADDKKIMNINRYGAVSASTTMEGRMLARAQFPGGGDPIKSAQLRAGYQKKAAQIGTLKGLTRNILGFESQMIGYYNNILATGVSGSGAGGMLSSEDLIATMGGEPLSMTSVLGLAGESLGIDALRYGGILQSLVGAQGFKGVDFLRRQGKAPDVLMTESGGNITRNVRPQTALPSRYTGGMYGSNFITSSEQIQAYLQSGISMQNVGMALGANRGGLGMNMIFSSGNPADRILAQGQALGLRGAGLQEYIAGYNAIAGKLIGRGGNVTGVEADIASLITAGRGLGGAQGGIFANAGGLRQYASMMGKGDVSGKFSGLFGGVGENIIAMETLKRAKGDTYKAYELSSELTLREKRDMIFNQVKGDENRRRVLAGMDFTPAQVNAMMTMTDATLPETQTALQTHLMSQTLSATKADTVTADTKLAADKYGLTKQIEISEQVLRQNVLQNANLEKIVNILSKQVVGGDTAAARREATRKAGK